MAHFHAAIRLDGPDGSAQPRPPYAGITGLTDVIRAAAPRTRISVGSHEVGERELTWASSSTCARPPPSSPRPNSPIRPWPPTWRSTPPKSADAPAPSTAPCTAAPARAAAPPSYPTGRRSRARLRRHRADPAAAPARRRPPCAADDPHLLGIGRLPEFAHLKFWKWAHMRGFRGHFSTKSRSYSVTLGALRDARRAWRTEQARATPACPSAARKPPSSSGHRNYLGTGYSLGAALLSAGVWHRRELERRFTAEGGC
ncbi:replication initiator [Streptomyces sp. NPDC088923]|uniref:replication initiator n=1 Tax=Streptomyces sp. NPDC088923 TaxID=3365913 RepID=UPI00381A4A5E